MQHLRYTWRVLWKNPTWTIIILFTIALGVGANTAIFTVNYATLFAPLPFPHPDQLVTLWTGVKLHRDNPPAITFMDWRREKPRAFQDIGAFTGGGVDIGGKSQPESLWGMRVSANYYRTLGESFFLGRDFLDEEERDGKNHVVILTHKLWIHLGADPQVIGHTLRVNGEPYTVVGVLQPGIADRDIFQLAVPLVFTPEELQHHDPVYLVVVGRLRPGATITQAQDEMNAIAAHSPRSDTNSAQAATVRISPLREFMFSMSSDSRRMLWWLLGAVVFVLSIACVNVANLLLAKGLTRQKELAVRTALGATRKTTFLQSLAESLLLAAAGGILGIGLGYSMLRGLLAELPRFTLPWATDTRLNLPVLFLTLTVTTLAGLVFGCVPAWYASRIDPNVALKSGGQAALGLGRHRLQRMLVIGELAVALTLIAGAGLALHSFLNLMQVDMGVRTDHVLTFYLGVPKTQSKDPEKVAAYYRQMLSSIQSVPGITSASAQTVMPLFPSQGAPFTIAGGSGAREDTSKWPSTGFGAITPGYFSTFGIRLMTGRIFNEQDTNSGIRVALVNEQFVRTYLNGADPLRQHILVQNSTDPAGTATEWQIAGVYRNVLSGSMRDHRPEILIPFWQSPTGSPSIAVRSAEDPELMTKSLAAAVHSVDTSATVTEPRTMEQIRNQVLGSDRFSMILLVGFGTVALVLATLGVYGVMSFSVANRTGEIALRMALGADRADLVAWVVSQGISLAVVGLSLGLTGAYFVGRGMRHSLFGVGQIDFTVLGIVALLLLFTVLIACLIPARRAAFADPMRALRTE